MRRGTHRIDPDILGFEFGPRPERPGGPVDVVGIIEEARLRGANRYDALFAAFGNVESDDIEKLYSPEQIQQAINATFGSATECLYDWSESVGLSEEALLDKYRSSAIIDIVQAGALSAVQMEEARERV